MLVTVSQAAKKGQVSEEEILSYIEKESLIAKIELKEGSKHYLIEEADLNAFLEQKSLAALWSEEDEMEYHESQTKSASNSLRRVLTAETVSELRIEHQVLKARVETLERLFSEFISDHIFYFTKDTL